MAYTTIDKPTDYFNTVLYTGNGTARNITTGLTSTDWVWIKRRDGTANHRIFDVVRGVHENLQSNTSNAEQNNSESLTAFGTSTFSLGTDSGGYDVNTSSQTYVSWNWSAGGTASSNSDGSITSTVSANQTAGFSIVSYTSGQSGAFSIGHGLSSAPKMFIAKSRDLNHSWGFYYTVRGTNTNWMTLNTTDAQGNNTADPDANGIAAGGVGHTGVFAILNSSTISIGPTSYANSGTSAIGYCFAEVKGFSKFGSYTGNGNADGTFVYTGFKPAFVISKRTDSTENWYMKDNKRSEFNPVDDAVYANSSASELSNWSGATTDYLSNGFKIRTVDSAHNASGGTYIYMAFAESPFVTSTGIPTVAR